MTQVYPHSIAYIRNHFVNFKVDLDIYGPANRVEYLLMQTKPETDAKLAESSEELYVWRVERQLKTKEEDTPYKHTLSQPMNVLVSNVNATNRYGNRRAYHILPLGMSRLMMPDTYVIAKANSWAKNPVTTFTSVYCIILCVLVVY